jgi:hypothetical protein
MVIAGKRGTELATTSAFVAIQPEYLAGLGFITQMSNTQLYNALLETEAILSFDKLVTDAMSSVTRMTSFAPGDPRFTEEVARLIDLNSDKNLKQLNRRAVERAHSFRESNGDAKTLMVWLVEGGPSTCPACLARAGRVRTYEDWIEMGMPGWEVCYGGGSCRCHLAKV